MNYFYFQKALKGIRTALVISKDGYPGRALR